MAPFACFSTLRRVGVHEDGLVDVAEEVFLCLSKTAGGGALEARLHSVTADNQVAAYVPVGPSQLRHETAGDGVGGEMLSGPGSSMMWPCRP